MTSHRIFLFWCLAAELVHGTLRSAALSQRAQTSGRLRAARSNFCMLVCDGGSSGSRMWTERYFRPLGKVAGRHHQRTLSGSFSVVSKPIFRKYIRFYFPGYFEIYHFCTFLHRFTFKESANLFQIL